MKADPQREKELWASLRAGREEALSELFMLYADDLYNYGYLLCRNKELVEDCLQDVFLNLWRKRKRLSDVKQVQTYLMVALRNRIRDTYRKNRALHPLTDFAEIEKQPADASCEDLWIESDHQSLRRSFIKEAMAALPERMRQAVYLRYFQGCAYEDIAEIMNVRPQVAVNMVYRATQKLRAYSERHSKWLFILLLITLLI